MGWPEFSFRGDRGGRDEGSRGRDDDRGGRGGFRGRDDSGGQGGNYRRRDGSGGQGGNYRRRDGSGGQGGNYRRRDDRSGQGGNFRRRDGARRGRDGSFRGKGGFTSDCPRFQNSAKGSFRGSRGLSRGGRGGGKGRGPKGGRKTIVEPHRHEGVFISRGKQDSLLTLNLVPGDKVYNEKHVVVDEGTNKIEYRTWNPFRSKLAAAIMGGIGEIHIKRGSHVLYLGAASGTTVSHVSDIVGADGIVYAVEFSIRSGRDLIDVAQRRMNIVPIIEDARHPTKYRMLVGAVDVIFSDVAQPDQARILSLNAQHYLKPLGHFIISIKAACIDSTTNAEAVVATEIEKLRKENLKPIESLTLEPYERNHTVVVGVYVPPPLAEYMKEQKGIY